jgi:hypothetical protein
MVSFQSALGRPKRPVCTIEIRKRGVVRRYWVLEFVIFVGGQYYRQG